MSGLYPPGASSTRTHTHTAVVATKVSTDLPDVLFGGVWESKSPPSLVEND